MFATKAQIQGMQEKVRVAQETMQRERQENSERLHQIEQEFLDKERRLNSKLKDQMNALIQQQIQEI